MWDAVGVGADIRRFSPEARWARQADRQRVCWGLPACRVDYCGPAVMMAGYGRSAASRARLRVVRRPDAVIAEQAGVLEEQAAAIGSCGPTW
jgi:hypothetical protein